MADRTTIWLHGNPVRAAGVLFYHYRADGALLVLLQNSKDKGFADFGGKSGPDEQRAVDFAIRKACEETNNVFKREMLEQTLADERSVYLPESKYQLYFCAAPFVEEAAFGPKQESKDRAREVRWFPADQLPSLHIRLAKLRKTMKTVVPPQAQK